MAKAEIYSGICGFTTRVTAVKGAGKGREMEVAVRLETDCPSWQKAAEEIDSLKPFEELFRCPLQAGCPKRPGATCATLPVRCRPES